MRTYYDYSNKKVEPVSYDDFEDPSEIEDRNEFYARKEDVQFEELESDLEWWKN